MQQFVQLTIHFARGNVKVINLGFNQGCESMRDSSRILSKIQDGKVQHYLRYIGVALVVLALTLIWGCR